MMCLVQCLVRKNTKPLFDLTVFGVNLACVISGSMDFFLDLPQTLSPLASTSTQWTPATGKLCNTTASCQPMFLFNLFFLSYIRPKHTHERRVIPSHLRNLINFESPYNSRPVFFIPRNGTLWNFFFFHFIFLFPLFIFNLRLRSVCVKKRKKKRAPEPLTHLTAHAREAWQGQGECEAGQGVDRGRKGRGRWMGPRGGMGRGGAELVRTRGQGRNGKKAKGGDRGLNRT